MIDEFREIESKYFLEGETYPGAIVKLGKALRFKDEAPKEKAGSGEDTFWRVDNDTFVRLRHYDEGDYPTCGQLSVKCNDKGGITDRLETNVELHTQKDLDNAKAMCNHLYGEPTRKVWKEYHIFYLSNGTNFVVYKTNYPGIPLILEFEAGSNGGLQILDGFAHCIFKLGKRVEHSLFTLVGMQE